MPQINQPNEEEATMNEVLDTINTFANNVYQKFTDIDKRLDKIEERMGGLESRMDGLEGKLTHFVTKEYLDDKLADLEARLIPKSEKKVNRLVVVLENKKILTPVEVSTINNNN